MDQARMIQKLETNLGTINQFFADIPTEEVRWKPEPGKWSMLEVLNHLCDEDRDYTLSNRSESAADLLDTIHPPQDKRELLPIAHHSILSMDHRTDEQSAR